jgi:proteasome lid subunit RPN8/RPN11
MLGEMGMDIELTRAAFEGISAEAERAFPEEACGLLFGHGRRVEEVVPTRNVHPKPRTHFESDPRALIEAYRAERQGGPQVLGYYHSHPAGPAGPSSTDQAQASGDARVWAIVAGDAVTFWRDAEGGVVALSYTVVER